MDQLTSNLLDLLFELQGRRIPIMIGGGFGLFLKRRHIELTGQRTLFDALPEPRATNDLDLFLRAELLSDLGRTREVREAILRLGYTPVEEAKYLHWKRSVLVSGVSQEVKIDVLVGPLGEYRSKLKVSMPRVRPRGDIAFHAYAVEEAVLLETNPVTLEVVGFRSSGEPYTGSIEVPDTFLPHDETVRFFGSKGRSEQRPRPSPCSRCLLDSGDDDGTRVRPSKASENGTLAG